MALKSLIVLRVIDYCIWKGRFGIFIYKFTLRWMFFSALLSYLAKGSIFLHKAHVQFSKCEGFETRRSGSYKRVEIAGFLFFFPRLFLFFCYKIHMNVDSLVIVRRNTEMILISFIENISRERSIYKFFL